MSHSRYTIKFIGLPVGVHEIEYKIGDEFFEVNSDAIIKKAQIDVQVTLNKGGAGTIQLSIDIVGDVWVECGRCLEEFQMPVDIQKDLVVRMVENPSKEDDDDDAIHISLGAHEIDLKDHLYDFISLEVPYLIVHPDLENGESGCNPEVLKLIQPDSQKEESTNESDRWEILKKIRKN